jgi:hypothetical protein
VVGQVLLTVVEVIAGTVVPATQTGATAPKVHIGVIADVVVIEPTVRLLAPPKIEVSSNVKDIATHCVPSLQY